MSEECLSSALGDLHIYNVSVILSFVEKYDKFIKYHNMEKWHIKLSWKNDDQDEEVCLVDKDLLKKLREKEKFLFETLGDKMSRYTENLIENVLHLHYLEKVKSEKNMWELKFTLRKAEIRFLGCLVESDGIKSFYALYAFRKKDQKIKDKHRETARVRVEDFIKQYKQKYGPQRIL